jgi:outer membrane protein TolC
MAAASLPAQEVVYSVDDLFRLANENNRSLQVSQAARQAADESLAQARAQRLPDIDAQLALSYNGRGILTDRDFTNLMNVYIPEFGNNFTFKVSQVLYSGGAISNAIRLGKLGQEMASLDTEKSRQDVRFMLVGEYLDLYQTLNAQRILEQNIQLAEKVLTDMRARYEQGTALRNDITRYEYQLESFRLQYAKAQDGYRILNHRLCTEVGLPEGTQILPDTTLLQSEAPTAGEAYWQQQTLSHNYGLQQASLAHQMSQRQASLAHAASLPHLSLFAEDYFNGPITVEVPPINKNLNYWYVGLGIQYNIGSIYRNKHEIRRAKWNVEKSQRSLELAKEEMNKGVQAAYTNYLTAFTELRTQQKSVKLATENYQVVENRYTNGLVLITDMLDASTLKLSADLKLVNAQIDLIYKYYQLKYLSHEL